MILCIMKDLNGRSRKPCYFENLPLFSDTNTLHGLHGRG